MPVSSIHPYAASGSGEIIGFVDSVLINIVFAQVTDLVSGVATQSGGNTTGPQFIGGLTSDFFKNTSFG
jgi:hypothetical protein